MTEKKRFTVSYSKQALNSATDIVVYLRNKFSTKEVDEFYQKLEDFEKIVSLYPLLYTKSVRTTIRRAVLSKVLTVYYISSDDKISIVDIHDNRWDFDKRIK